MMNRLNTFICTGLFALCATVPWMSSAATFTNPGSLFTSSPTGTITLKTPSSFGASVTCRIQLTGGVRLDGSAADIQYARFSGTEPLCQRIQMNNGATWKLTPTTLTTGDLSNVGFVITALLPIIPASNCGPATISVGLVNGPGVVNVSALNMYLPGSCAVASLNVAIPATSITP